MTSISSKDKHIELRTKEIGLDLFLRVEGGTASIFQSQWWEDQILEWLMNNEEMKTQLLRFVDVFPSLRSPRRLANHLRQYFPRSNRAFPAFLRVGIDLSAPTFLTRSLLAHETRAIITRMARRFIAGEKVADSFDALKGMRKKGMAFTLDLLGEAVLSEAEAEKYMEACIDAIRKLSRQWGRIEHGSAFRDTPNLSLKLSSLYSQFDPIDNVGTKNAVKERLGKILRVAKETGAFVNVDMEQYSHLELTMEIFRELLDEEEFRGFSDVGIVLQAYLRDSERLLLDLLEWVARRGTPVTVRLVKGAYWDYEIIHARQMGWPIPVFASKPETDANFERLTEILLAHFPAVRTALGTHNIRSMAHAMAVGESLGLGPTDLEFQMLYGMGDPIKEAVLQAGYPLRAYTPFGELIPGMAYLVRRILENTSNESFLRQDSSAPPEELLERPSGMIAAEIEKAPGAEEALPRGKVFENEPESDFSMETARENMQMALKKVRGTPGGFYPLVIGGEAIESGEAAASIDPSDTNHVVGTVALASIEHADRAVDAARAALENWRRVPPAERAECMFRTAEIIGKRRFELAALEVYEVGKTAREADGDVVEAIDYLNYYGCEMLRLGADPATVRLPGETNEYVYRPRGVGAVIAPWNFPLAILTGMTSVAIAAGNTVIMKPAPQSPVVAAHLMRIYEEAGIPPGVVNYLPGPGETVGERLVKNPGVDFVVFTGSCEVGTRINRLAAEHPSRNGIKKVVAEMGGKNAIIIDESADLDEAVDIANGTSFGLTGGLYSRTPDHIERARRDLMVGNLYINRKITGAVVRRQPFGGFKMSGIGSKAGGPDYLPQFMLARTISENVMRHGFAPLDD